jgi:hypothetical protein
MMGLDFFQEEGFEGETFPFLQGISLVTRQCYFDLSLSSSVPSISSPSPPFSSDMEVIFTDALS